MGQRNYMFDKFSLLSDNLTPYTTAQIAKVAGSSQIYDSGAPQTRSDLGLVGGLARIDSAIVVDVSAITVGATNYYDLIVMGSNNSNGSSGVILGALKLGNTAVLPNGAATSTIGRYEILFPSEQADVNYEFIYIWVNPVGTSPSITFNAFIAPLPVM